jgi:hypothetical protein
VSEVRVDDPAGMNVLGLFLASALRRRLAGRPCTLRGALVVDAGGMRAMVHFGESGATVTRAEGPARTTVSGPLPLLVRALVRPGLGTLLRVKIKGSRLFALRAMRRLAP